MLKKRMFIALCLVMVIAGCTSKNPTQQVDNSSTQPAPLVSGSNNNETSTQPAEALVQGSTEVFPQSPLQVIIDNPKDGGTVNSQDVTIVGRTAPGAVVSINDSFTVADPSGKFSLTLHLDTGLQMITIEASNNAGEDVILTLSVDVQPG